MVVSALADALVAAQRRALAAVEKQYAAGNLEPDAVREQLDAIGLSDTVDVARLLAALDLIRDYGASLPAEPAPANGKPETEKATDAQLALIAKLVKEKNQPPPDGPLTKQEAHEVIDGLKAGTYDAGRWRVSFL
jgi:hypothetical protein